MTHKAETILNNVESVLTGLTTTGTNVQRARAWPVSQVPALSIYMASDERDEDLTSGVIKRVLNIDIVAYVRAVGNLETTLNQIKTEVFAAITADITLSGAAINAELVIDERPVIEAEQEEPTAIMVMSWRVQYRHSATSTEV